VLALVVAVDRDGLQGAALLDLATELLRVREVSVRTLLPMTIEPGSR